MCEERARALRLFGRGVLACLTSQPRDDALCAALRAHARPTDAVPVSSVSPGRRVGGAHRGLCVQPRAQDSSLVRRLCGRNVSRAFWGAFGRHYASNDSRGEIHLIAISDERGFVDAQQLQEAYWGQYGACYYGHGHGPPGKSRVMC